MPKVVAEYREQAKGRILGAALRVFSEKGYHETSMENIAQALGVSKGALYLYFGSKEELFEAICEPGPQILRETLLSLFKDADLVRDAEAFFDAALKEANPGLNFEILAEASRNVALRKVLKKNYDNTLDVVTGLLRDQKEKGRIRQDLDADLLARSLVAVYQGFLAGFVIGVDKLELKRAWIELLKPLTYGPTRKLPI